MLGLRRGSGYLVKPLAWLMVSESFSNKTCRQPDLKFGGCGFKSRSDHLGLVYATPGEFENGRFSLKMHQVFYVHINALGIRKLHSH